MEFEGIEIPVLVVGITQVIKLLIPNLSEKGKLVIALVVGVILLSLAQALPYMSTSAVQIVMAVVRVLGYATSIPGWFSVVKDEVLRRS